MRVDRSSRAVCFCLATALALAMAGTAHADSKTIGRAGAVRNQVEGVVGGKAKKMAVRDPLLLNQQVRTGADSTAQLLFLDETSLSVGPGSDVTLDKFVYDPDRAQNDIAVSAGKGIFRFISGSSDPRSYHLKTPVATIGVRGTIYDGIFGLDQMVIVLVEGKLIVTLPDGRVVQLNRPGQSVKIHKGGRVEGPKTWDGTIIKVTGVVPYPLFGDSFLPFPSRVDVPTPRTQIVNGIDAGRQNVDMPDVPVIPDQPYDPDHHHHHHHHWDHDYHHGHGGHGQGGPVLTD